MAGRAPVYQDKKFVGWVDLPHGMPLFINSHGHLFTANDVNGANVVLRTCVIEDRTDPHWFGVAFDVVDDGVVHPFNSPDYPPHKTIHESMTKETQHATH